MGNQHLDLRNRVVFWDQPLRVGAPQSEDSTLIRRIGYVLVWSLVLMIAGGACQPAPEPASEPSPTALCAEGEACQVFTAFITGYSYYDNTPPGSAKISHPVIHQTAGGTGTWEDPITMAVGHTKKANYRSVLDYPEGTRFYLPYLKKYFIVEDTCGDGPRPQDGACHTNQHGPEPWLDIWINGKGLGDEKTRLCAESITGNREVIQIPPAHLPVEEGNVCD